MNRKLGLKPVKRQPRLKLSDFTTSDLPTYASLPATFGNPKIIAPQMFMNDKLGCCAIAGSFEEIRWLNAANGKTVNFTDQTAVQTYTDITGYNPDDPDTDQGTDVHQLFDYRKNTGITDADGDIHTLIDYVGLTPGDWQEAMIALSLFGVVSIGLRITDYAEPQFEAGQPWHLIPGRHKVVGGHYVPLVSRSAANTAGLYTWGALGGIDADYYTSNNLVAVVSITKEMFTPQGKEAFNGAIDFDQLSAALPQLNTGQVSGRKPRKAFDDTPESDH
jgi:hypothetical protein